MKLLALALCWLSSHTYAPGGRTPRRLVAVRAESEDRAEQIKKLNDMFYGTSTTTTDPDASTDAASAADDAADPLADLPLWRVQWNALPGERQVYNVHVPHYTALFEKLVRGPKPWYFGHILLPGGSANLRIPKYNLKDGPEATTLGTVMECLAVERRTDGCLVVVSQGVGRFRVQNVKRTLPHDVVDASWVLDKEEGDHDAWRAFEFGPGGVKLSSTTAEVAELAPLRLDRAPVQSGIVVEEMADPVDGDTASDDVEQRVWDAVAVDGGLLEKILMADGTPEEQAKIRLPPSLLALKPEAAPDAWPSARRRLRLSFAVPAALGLVDVAEGRQGLLEASSTANRLRQVERALTRRAAHLRGILSQKLQKRREN